MRIDLKHCRFSTVCLLLSAFFCFPATAQEDRPVVFLQVKGTIEPGLSRYLVRGLEEAREMEASAVVIELDTPGGLDGSMRRIVQGILNSPVPVIVYVSPSGARAASAGVFITLAAHVAAMTPGTNIGAAHPVRLGAGGEIGQNPSPMEEKMVNDAAAYLHSIVELRSRNVGWAQSAVKESRSLTAEQAASEGVIDLVSGSGQELLQQLHGRQVQTVFGLTTLDLKDQPLRRIPPSFMERFLHTLAHPTLAYLLLLLGIYGLIYELATPGAVFPGVIGVIFLIIALTALEALEVNWAGIFLMAGSILFFIADIKLPGYGALTIGGIIAFFIGSAFLFPETRIPDLRLGLSTIAAAAVANAAFFILIVRAGIRALRRKVMSGTEALIGLEGVARTDLKPEGLVSVHGEEWKACAEHHIPRGSRIRVVRLEGLTVHVEQIKEGS